MKTVRGHREAEKRLKIQNRRRNGIYRNRKRSTDENDTKAAERREVIQ